MNKVLMVCLGNICRSPMAHGLLEHKAAQRGIELEVDSAGTSNYHVGDAPDERGTAVMAKNGIDIRHQRARQFSKADFEAFDHILVMDSSNYNDVVEMAETEEQLEKVKFMLNYSNPHSNQRVPDPYYGGDSGFDEVYALLEVACDAFLDQEYA